MRKTSPHPHTGKCEAYPPKSTGQTLGSATQQTARVRAAVIMSGLDGPEQTAATATALVPAAAAKAIGRRLVQVRGRCTQEVFADHLGVHVNTLARYERGERLPGTLLYLQLINQGVDLYWLLTGRTTNRGTVPEEQPLCWY